MQQQVKASPAFVQAVESIDTALDGVVDHGSDDELFIASYLQGHFAVEARKLELDDTASVASLDEALRQSLQDAFTNNELEPADQQAVFALWQKLLSAL
ncbi:YfcL family protein [Alteromonas lipolytica]|uniref:YfcL protein n=1 Tax=Alteromonas lipolytica TaxID=1856405 RepID=A0A1E8FFQ5_9ALTE|nr:YfcL family protein [Alteromonas lipolytica]OFI34750.1 hypothetical protein BFC17_14315 [Alteromonas lipolytica]GGF53696.1 hypothetical protein GCM10011338_02310 [Alteromonas lipolytica]